MENYVSLILRKEVIKIVSKGFIMLKIQSLEKMPKKFFILLKFYKLLLLLQKWILKNKIIGSKHTIRSHMCPLIPLFSS
jgi:hypothetical protein